MIQFNPTNDPRYIECDGFVMVFPSEEAAQLALRAPEMQASASMLVSFSATRRAARGNAVCGGRV